MSAPEFCRMAKVRDNSGIVGNIVRKVMEDPVSGWIYEIVVTEAPYVIYRYGSQLKRVVTPKVEWPSKDGYYAVKVVGTSPFLAHFYRTYYLRCGSATQYTSLPANVQSIVPVNIGSLA